MGVNVTFDPVNYIIQIDKVPTLVNGENVNDLNFKIDFYSDGKEDWLIDASLIKHQFPIRTTGGDSIPGGDFLGDTYFILPPWKIRPHESNHVNLIEGNFFMEDGTDPFTATLGTYNVSNRTKFSSLVQTKAVESSVAADIEILKGLNIKNQVMDNIEYDLAGNMTAARIRIFSTRAEVIAATKGGVGEGEIATFDITADILAGKTDIYRSMEEA